MHLSDRIDWKRRLSTEYESLFDSIFRSGGDCLVHMHRTSTVTSSSALIGCVIVRLLLC